MTPLGGGQGGALPHGAGLPGGCPGGDHFEQPVGLGRGHAGLEQPLPRGRHQLGHELGSGQRPYLIPVPGWPAQLGCQAVLGGTVETMIGALERQRVSPLLVLRRQPQGQPDQEGGIGEHVNDGGAGGQGPQRDPQMPAQCRVVDGPVPAPHGALVQPELVQRRRLPPGAAGPQALARTALGTGWCSRMLSVNSSSAPPRSQPVPSAVRASRRRGPWPWRSSTDCLNRAIRVSSQSRWPRNVGELPDTASTGAVATWTAL